jgi:WD40 repeat protein
LFQLVETSDTVRTVAFSPDGSKIASGGPGPDIRLWELGTGGHLTIPSAQTHGFTDLDFSPDGQLLASGGHSEIRLWDVAAQRERLTFSRHTNTVRALAFLMDNKTLASADKDGAIRLWDTATGDLRATGTKLIGNPDIPSVPAPIGRRGFAAYSLKCDLHSNLAFFLTANHQQPIAKENTGFHIRVMLSYPQ